MICIHLHDAKGEGFTVVLYPSPKNPGRVEVRADFTHPDDEERLGQNVEVLTSTQIESLIEFLRGCL